jgi:predicted metal-dependent HD superfamily phosphohydrolase
MTEENTRSSHQKILAVTLAGSLVAMRTHPTADTEHPDIDKYLALLEESPTRKFHSFEYVCNCVSLARDIPVRLKNNSLVVAALLFHKIAYVPGDKKHLRKSCEKMIEFYGISNVPVKLMRLMRLAQIESSLVTRYGDDRDYIADIVHYYFGLPWEEFKKVWAQILLEFRGKGYSPQKFKKFTRVRLEKLQEHARTYGIYRTKYFAEKFERQAIENIEQMLREL